VKRVPPRPLPAEKTAEQELINSLGWLITLRWFAGCAVVAASFAAARLLHLDVPERWLYAVGLGILAYNAGLLGGLHWLQEVTRSRVVYEWFARYQIALDWAAMAVLIHLSGGIESPAIIFYLFHITIASLLLPHDRGFLYVTLAPVLVGSVALLEYQGVLPHVRLFEPLAYDHLVWVGAVLFFFACAAYAMAYFSMAISRRLRRRENELAGLYQSARLTSSTLDLQLVLNRLTEATVKALRCKGSSIRLLDKTGSHLEMASTHGLSDAYAGVAPLDLGRALIDREVLAGGTVLVQDAPNDPRIQFADAMRAEGLQSELCVPVVGKRGAIGVIRAYGGVGHRFTKEDAAFLKAVAAQGAVAIENAEAYQLLENLDNDKSRFVRTVTHELRAPVQVAENLLAVLREGYAGQLSSKQDELVGRASQRIRFLEMLVNDLLDLAAGKVQARVDRLEPSPVSLNTALGEIHQRYETTAVAKGLSLQLDRPAEPLCVWGDRGDVDRILTNLVGNALKYTRHGEVRLRLERAEDHARIVIADTGIGIPDEAQPHLFEEFYRAGNAKALEEEGTGLGLAIVRDLVRRLDGRITVESVEKEGTTFTVTLPLARQASGDGLAPCGGA
jgi:signal transduction histidine kinase